MLKITRDFFAIAKIFQKWLTDGAVEKASETLHEIRV